jgi:hypothetical protein
MDTNIMFTVLKRKIKMQENKFLFFQHANTPLT